MTSRHDYVECAKRLVEQSSTGVISAGQVAYAVHKHEMTMDDLGRAEFALTLSWEFITVPQPEEWESIRLFMVQV